MYEQLDFKQRDALRGYARQALEVQDACNLCAVADALHEAISFLMQVSRTCNLGGTDWVNTHPVVRMYTSKLIHLSQFTNGVLEISDAYDYCDKLAEGFPVEPHKYTPTV